MPRLVAPQPSSEFSITLAQPFTDTLHKKRIDITGEPNRDANIKVTERTGQQMENINEHVGSIDNDDVKELLSLVSDLRGLPTDPNKDIYGLDTRISMATFDIQWDNADDGGVGEITDETKDTFKRIAESIQALARQKAKQQSRQ